MKSSQMQPRVFDVCPGIGSLQAMLDGLNPGDRVVFAPKLYRKALVVRRSGPAEPPIVIEAARPGTVVITGADVVEGWTETGKGTGVWTAPCDLWHLPDGLRYGQPVGRCEQVLVDGQPLRQVDWQVEGKLPEGGERVGIHGKLELVGVAARHHQ
jgi:hypothetical protein